MKMLACLGLVLLLTGCFFDYTPAIDVTAVSFDWSNTVWENVQFTVKNTGDVELDAIDIYYTAHCVDGDFDHVANFPSIYFDDNSPVDVGAICYAGTALATLTGGALSIDITQVSVDYSFTSNEILAYTKTFTKP